ncbi:hypothetical protein ACFSBZ_06740 [Amnibacterium flavum]|uniref:Uncharacterized protein n=1 Tax=Amnibacterium flavum TaxID=2173173 RepID=A0A2V1HU86_9MICO|nr:hypothetical protein [Amnibacterium flavum]PVZ93857.1 hypothetical protein DDQ50_08735 [Amnibacterium flavum]
MSASTSYCAYCVTPFSARRADALYCTDAHRAAATRERVAARARHAEVVAALLRQRDARLLAEVEADAAEILRAPTMSVA